MVLVHRDLTRVLYTLANESMNGGQHKMGLLSQSSFFAGKIKYILVGIMCFCILENTKTDARPIEDDEDPYRQPAHMPYWPFTSNDFWAYVEYFRTLGAYHQIHEMARTFFAHYPLGNTLGYDVPYHEQ
ncbi:otospiralin [Varanus komodoensis]|uniref:otospiralin n=1 Tax=Varanus komodoensis TaxID=61221 RepID=UPI001CF7E2BB|nr:otospiralin [Varanus komodoensis]